MNPVPGWKRHFKAKTAKDRQEVLEALKDVPVLFPESLPDYWINVQSMLARHLTLSLEEAVQVLLDRAESSAERETIRAWISGYTYAVSQLMATQLTTSPLQGTPEN